MAGSSRVLIVDDYPDALQVWSLYLRAKGFDVVTAVDGFEAVAAATRDKPDVIVMDLELPGKSGFEAAREIRADDETRTIPLIAATGYSHLKQLDQARLAGFDAVVVKPCEPDTLLAEIDRLLAASRIGP